MEGSFFLDMCDNFNDIYIYVYIYMYLQVYILYHVYIYMSQFGGFLAGFLFVTCECVGAHLVRENPAVRPLATKRFAE